MEHKYIPDITEQELDICRVRHHRNQTLGKTHIFFKALWRSQSLLAIMAFFFYMDPKQKKRKCGFMVAYPFL